MRIRRWIALLLALALLPALCGGAFGAEPEAEEISPEDYALVDQLWEELNQAEQRAMRREGTLSTQTVTESTARAVAEAVQQSEIYVEGSLRWRGGQFSFETTTGVTCGYSPRLRSLARNAAAAQETEPEVQVQSYGNGTTAGSLDVYLIGPYYGIDSNFTRQYRNEAQALAQATGGTYTLYQTNAATVDAVAQALVQGGVVFFDSHGDTDYYDEFNPDDCVTGATTSYLLLQTGAGLTSADYAYDNGTYHAQDMGRYGSMAYYAVDGTCIANHMQGQAPNSLVWSAICLGMATDGLCAPLREKGVGVFYGYSQSVTFDFDYLWEEAFFDELIGGADVATAVAAMKKNVGQWDQCDRYTNLATAREYYCAFPVVASGQDAYPGHGKVDDLQQVKSEWQLPKEPPVVTAVSSSAALGTVSVSGYQVTAYPSAQAYVSGWSLDPSGAAQVQREGNVFTLTEVREDCCLRVDFAPKIPATVRFSVPNGVQMDAQRGYVGDPVPLTAPVGTPAHTNQTYTFLGWTEAPVENAAVAPAYYTDAFTPVRTETTLYALYTYESGDGLRYTTVTGGLCPAEQFSDVNTAYWYHDALDFVLEQGLMNGTGHGKFEPDANLSRAMLVTMLYRLDGDTGAHSHPFTDVLSGSWYEAAVAWAYETGVVTGVTAETFAPDQPVTREQTAAMLWRYAGSHGQQRPAGADLAAFKDADRISGYAMEPMRWAVTTGILHGMGDGTLAPAAPSTRAHAAQMLYNWLGEA